MIFEVQHGSGPSSAATQTLVPHEAFAQSGPGTGNPDAELRALQGARRILLKGGVVLSLDPQVGDFAQADVLIEDGKIREVRAEYRGLRRRGRVVDATNRIVIPGFVDTHGHFYQGLLRSILPTASSIPTITATSRTTLTPAYHAADALCRRCW